ncbi:multidrug effflux MFS transporter [Aestuariibaculum marinum]|uniref:Multidrug effflux MFS transporter n=1 Tax=Aestuariibaculum marinum TaxID=2683592 RepID=A0A8J6QDT4_9FLAO|nr:multidrug effflux MFS transporter [Aestuariibaculum marinum]MBD0825231.1 multidrug effflux MFS transporter [Aestuariibaculum marinum]
MKKFRVNKGNSKIIILFLAALIALSPFAIDSYLSAMPLMATFFGVDINVIELTITLYFLGFSIGNFFGGPLSDAYGRKPVALTGITLYGLSALAIPFCSAIEGVLALRILQAFGGGFATVTANLFIRDWYKGEKVAKLITITTMIMMLAPLFAPVFGSVIIHYNGWQGVFLFLFIWAVILFTLFYMLIPESREDKLISRRFNTKELLGKYKVFLSDRKSVIMLMAISFPVSGLYIFITSSSFIYLEYFKVDQAHFPLIFGATILLNILLSLLNTYLLKFYKPKRLLHIGLYMQLLAGFLLFLTVQSGNVSFWSVFVLIVFYVGSLGLVFGNGTALILNINPEVSGSANATLGIFRFLLGFVSGTLIALFHSKDLVPIGVAMFTCSLIGNLFFFMSKKVKKSNPEFAINTPEK